MAIKVTYSVTAGHLDALDREFEAALSRVRGRLGQVFPALLGYQVLAGGAVMENRNPADTRMLLGRHHQTPVERVDDLLSLAHDRQPDWWRLPGEERCRLLRRVADRFRERQFDLAAAMTLEVGKTRLESLGEVQECVDMIHYYVDQYEQNQGYVRKMAALSPGEETVSLLKPYGVFAVIEPFNFPLALAVGALTAALVGGNTAVFKPASATPWSAWNLLECFRDGGVP
jgi:1-pyrroline-5-carboxylate dehydrogenase